MPKSVNKDIARQEFILNILLGGSLFFTFIAFVITVFNRYYNVSVEDALVPQTLIVFFIFLVILFNLSRKGKVHLSAFLLIAFFYMAGTYTLYKWGADVALAWLIFSLVIVMSGVLIGTRFAFFLTISLVIVISLLSLLQLAGFYTPITSWKMQQHTFGDTILLNIALVVISIIAWLSNREAEKSLKRARASERELKFERDQLEIKVEERTQELKRIQLEKITQLYRFAEIGQLTSGFMHDLVNPISLISLNLHKLNRESQQKKLAYINILLKRALKGTRYLEDFVTTARKQLQNQEVQKTFSLNQEIKHIIQILSYKANKMRVKIIFEPTSVIRTFGNPIKFHQIAMNLILNAVDAYDEDQENNRVVKISVTQTEEYILLNVHDFGVGISKEHLKKIFNPFFTTKAGGRGIGIGLSITKDIVKKTFHGKITVKTGEKIGTIFTVKFLRKYPTITQSNEADN